MKKIAKYFFAALAVASAVSCAQELTDDFRPADKTQQGKSYVFTASMDDTKAILDEYTMENFWYGDEDGKEYISILEPANEALDIEHAVFTYAAYDVYEPVTSAEFVNEDEENGIVGNEVFAVYPAGDWTSFSGLVEIEGEEVYQRSIDVVYPTVQAPVYGSYDPKAAVAVAYNDNLAENQNLHFQNATALLKIEVAENSEPVSAITVYANGGEKLTGAMTLMELDGEGSIVPAETAKSYVTIENTEYEFIENGGTYYLAVAPAVLKSGIALQFNYDETQTYTISREIAIERGKIYDLGLFSCTASENTWYLIGDFCEGNLNKVQKVAAKEVNGAWLFEGVEIGEGQGFKIYNPTPQVAADGETVLPNAYYPNVAGIEAGAWYPVTTEGTYGYAKEAGTYDVWVDAARTGIALVTPDAGAPDYALPIGQYITTLVDDVRPDGMTYAIDIRKDGLTLGRVNENDDPSMYGKWLTISNSLQYSITSETACTGVISVTDEDWNSYVVNYAIGNNGSVVLFTSKDKDGKVLNNGLGVLPDMNGYTSATWTEAEEELEFGYPYPTGQFVWTVVEYVGSENEFSYDAMLDLGVIEEGVMHTGILVSDDYFNSQNSVTINSIEPWTPQSGQIITSEGIINYSNYNYDNGIITLTGSQASGIYSSSFMGSYFDDEMYEEVVYMEYETSVTAKLFEREVELFDTPDGRQWMYEHEYTTTHPIYERNPETGRSEKVGEEKIVHVLSGCVDFGVATIPYYGNSVSDALAVAEYSEGNEEMGMMEGYYVPGSIYRFKFIPQTITSGVVLVTNFIEPDFSFAYDEDWDGTVPEIFDLLETPAGFMIPYSDYDGESFKFNWAPEEAPYECELATEPIEISVAGVM